MVGVVPPKEYSKVRVEIFVFWKTNILGGKMTLLIFWETNVSLIYPPKKSYI